MSCVKIVARCTIGVCAVVGISKLFDFKSGVPRMAYKGVVSTFYKGIRVYLWPGLNWKSYNPTW